MLNRSEWLALVLAAAAIAFQSFVRPSVGLADNGDFAKIAGWFDTGNPFFSADVLRFADTKYSIDPQYRYLSGFYSSEILFFTAALGLNSVFGNPDVFDLRLMGAVHAALFLGAIFLFLPLLRPFALWRRALIQAMVLAGFTDLMYTSYFNSMYMDTAALLFILLAVVTFLRALLWHRAVDRWMFVVSAGLLINSKAQHFPLGILLIVLLAWKGEVLAPPAHRWSRALPAAVLLMVTAFSMLFGAPSNYAGLASYNVVFSGLLPKSANPAAELKELGLESSDQRYIGTNAYSQDSGLRDPYFEKKFMRSHFYPRMAIFLAKHPSRALDTMIARMDSAGLQRPFYGNFDRSAGFPPLTRSSRLALWSDLKARLFGRHGWRYLVYSLSLGLIVTVLAIARAGSLPAGVPEAACALCAMMLLELLGASFGDALDAERHYSLFSALTDLLVICGVCLSTGGRKAAAKPYAPPARTWAA